MSDKSPKEFVFNGIHGRTGQYLLTLNENELIAAARGLEYDSGLYDELALKHQKEEVPDFAIEFGRLANDLGQAGWGIVFPAKMETRERQALHDALKVLLDWRKQQALAHDEPLYKEYIQPEVAVLPGESALKFMTRHGASPGDVDPTLIPYYLLLVGSPAEIPFSFQFELDVTYLVGRIYFGKRDQHGNEVHDLEAYALYAQSVVEAEKSKLKLPRRTVFFAPAHEGDPATIQSSADLVNPLAAQLTKKYTDKGWQIEHIEPDQSKRSRLEALMGRGDAPGLLFTASHGVGFDANDPAQEALQGGLLCQDFSSVREPMDRSYFLAAEDIADDFKLHGMIAFHFACFGAGTPMQDSFPRVTQKIPKQIANRDFIAALPTRLLSHPKGGALAVVGHVDRAWTYSFKWADAKQQTATFQSTLEQIMSGDPVGLAFDRFNARYAQVAVQLQPMLNNWDVVPKSAAELGSLWTANNDARGYTLLGDPAARLSVAEKDEEPDKRKTLKPVEVRTVSEFGPAETAPLAATSEATDTQSFETSAASGATLNTGGGPTTIQISPQGQVTIHIAGQPEIQTAEDFFLWGRGTEGTEAATDEPGPMQTAMEKLQKFVVDLGERVEEFARDVTALEVRTYVSEAIEDVDVKGGKLTGDARQRAVTIIQLDGDTEVVVPTYAGEIDQLLWAIHTQAVEQAQEHRAAMLKTIGELVSSILPGVK